MSEARSLSLGTQGERDWRYLRNAYLLGPEKGCSLLISDSGEVRSEVRRRMESLASTTIQVEPSREILVQIQQLAAEAEAPPLVWIEAREVEDPERAWADALLALNHGRDLVWDEGPVYVVLAGPAWLHRRLREGAPDLASTINPVVVLDETLELLVEPSEPLCWLHISDLHVRSADWQQDVVLEALLRDLPGLLGAAERAPKLLFITGDLANRGVGPEYEGALVFLTKLSEQLGLSRERVFMVPGNHDVDRSAITSALRRSEKLFDSLERDEDEFRTAIGEIIESPDEIRRYGRRLTAWCRFTADFLGLAKQVAIDRPWRSDLVELAGVRVGVASICSAWLSGPDDAKGKLVVGELQVRQLAEELRQAGAQLRVALLHHPLAWLREAEEKHVRALLRNEFDVVLHGHAHHPEAGTFVHGQRDTVEIGGGATYAGLGQDRFHGFQVAQLDVEAGQLVIDAFTWTTRNGGHWHLDAGFHRDAPQGRMTLPLRLAHMGSSGAAGQPDALAARLRRATALVHGAQAFIGLADAAPRPKASLSDMFVPLELRPRSREGDALRLEVLRDAWLAGAPAARAVILGNPGAGKSTLCRYLAVEAAAMDEGLVPLLLTVRDWAAEGAREGILELAQRHVERHLGIRADVATLAALCREGRVLVLIDGVDEAGTRERVVLRDRLHAFVGEYPKVGVIATSRVLGYDDAPLRDDRFEHFELEPFDEPRLKDFVGRWYAVAEPHDPSERQRRSAELWAALEAEPRAMQLARNPLLATLIAMVHFHRAQLPGDRARLYQLCIELMIVTWPAANGRTLIELEGFRQLPMLEELALWMQSQRPEQRSKGDQRGILISGAQLDRQLDELLAKHLDELDLGRRRALVDKWRRWLVRESGLVQEQQNDRFGFLHLSLMEYLAGQAALREQARAGHHAIASYVVTMHRKRQWIETLLSMIGSQNDDRELGNAVVEALLGAERSWDTCMFMLSLLREEVDVDPALRTRVLDAVAESTIEEDPPDWDGAGSVLADVLRFGRKHGPPLRQWIDAGLATRRGESLVGELVILPQEIGPTPGLEARSDEDLQLAAVLDLGENWYSFDWGGWARARATRTTIWTWVRSTPLAGILRRAIASESAYPEIWSASLMRRNAWLSRSAQRAVLERDRLLPDRIRWISSRGACVAPTMPAFVVEGECGDVEFARGFSESVVQRSASWFAYGVMEDSMSMWGDDVVMEIAENFSGGGLRMWMWRNEMRTGGDFAQSFSSDFAEKFARHFAPELVLEELRPEPRSGSIDPPTRASGLDSSALSQAKNLDEAKQALAPILLAMIADAHAGMLLAPSDSPTTHIADARLQNRWLNTFFDPLVDYLARNARRTPQRHALFLALGLAQFQTTWSWPAGRHWRAWFSSGEPPEYWLAAYFWHACWAVGDPTNPEHLIRAQACLERGDSPELVAELRKYPLRPTPPEVHALFEGGEPGDAEPVEG